MWQRPNHLLARIARESPVIVLEEPLSGERDEDIIERADGVTVVTPRRTAAGDAVDARALDTVHGLLDTRAPLVWLYTPMMLGLADAFAGAPLVFDKMDELADFAHADPRLPGRERALLARADVVFAGGRSLYRSISGRARIARCYPSGVDVAHFAAAQTSEPHPELAPFRDGPVFGYIGVIDERIDLGLIDAIAQAHPAATLAMIGPVVKIDPGSLPRRANISYLGSRTYDELPTLLAGIEVALMPFALNRHTAKISPTKTLEYLAAGRPVVSTAVPDVVEEYAEIVHIGADHAEFVALLERARRPDPARTARAAQRVGAATWDAIAEAMRGDLAGAGIAYAAASPARSSWAALA